MEQKERLQRFLTPILATERETIVSVNFLNCDPNLEMIPITVILPIVPVLLSILDMTTDRMLHFAQTSSIENVIDVPRGRELRIYWSPNL